MKRNITLGILFFVTLIACLIFDNFFKREYYILLKKDGTIANYDKNNKLNGEITIFKNGILEEVTNYKHGKKEGWDYLYYSNGQIDIKRCYHSGELNGPEFKYYEDGKLNYKATIKNNKRFGSFYCFSENGKLVSYSVFDIFGKSFCTFNYNNFGEITKFNPIIISKTYSIDTKTDTVTLLHFEEKNQNVKDLYVMIASPPNAQLEISVIVNRVHINNIKIIENTVRINNAISKKGLNEIYMTFNMFYRNQKIIDNLTADLSILKE